MKKVLLVVTLAVFGLSVSNAQELKVGAHGALAVVDFGYDGGFGLDVSYLWKVSGGFYAGGATGYNHFSGEDYTLFTTPVEVPDFQFIPVAASARYIIGSRFITGLDLGYAIGVGEGRGSDFYYRPKMGYDFGFLGVITSFAGVADFTYLTFGVEFTL